MGECLEPTYFRGFSSGKVCGASAYISNLGYFFISGIVFTLGWKAAKAQRKRDEANEAQKVDTE